MNEKPFDQDPQYFSRSPEQFGGKIPFIVTDIVEKLRELGGVDTEGIFRLSGSAEGISNLCRELDRGRVKDWSQYTNIHTIACTLKKYFRDLVPKDPLIPSEYYNEMINIPDSAKTTEEAVQKYKAILNNFSVSRLLTFAYLFKFFADVAASTTSKMTASNIAIVFAPNLLSPRKKDETAESQIMSNTSQNRTITMMINNYDKIFGDIEITKDSFINDEDMEILAPTPIEKKDISRYLEIRNLRRQSLIQFIPYELLQDHTFVRPSRVVKFSDDE
ncbi:RhoGAP domain containing protein [Histomonas meleagridis]|uniref:RhoGAP domain containing protein n=1 Tax=Histomonas meleagridis TaxID=135588 RepID=UPI0035599456|nr:RhoGAP domain containing protein [Histomonas meleagridis]KAH0807020.1 RhoGAP domain containing protein [Histomonas meleagridis]